MNINSIHTNATEDKGDPRPILVVPYMWIGDFVRGHTVVRILKQRWPNRPIDLLTTSLCAPLADYMTGVRSGIVWALPRFIDKNAALALPEGSPLPPEWPVPQLNVPAEEAERWRQASRLGTGPAVALAPGSVGASKRWTYYPEAARLLAERGLDVW